MIETMESDKPNFAKQYFVDKSVEKVAFILERIDKKWPHQPTCFANCQAS